MWDIEQNRLLKIFNGQNNPIQSVSFSGNEKFVVAGSGKRNGDLGYSIKIYDTKTQKVLKTLKSNRYIKALDVSLGRYVISALEDSYNIKLWDTKRKRKTKTLTGHIGQVNDVAISWDGTYLLSASDDKTIKLWRRKNGRLIHTFKGHKDAVISVALSHDDRYIISASLDKTIKIWDRKGQKLLKTIHTDKEIATMSISPNGKYIITASTDMDEDKPKVITIWDREKGTKIQTFQSNREPIKSLAISNSAKEILSTSNERILLWSTKNPQKPIKEFTGGANGQWIIIDNLQNRYIQAEEKSGELLVDTNAS